MRVVKSGVRATHQPGPTEGAFHAPYAPFAIRTPASLATDLGTETGVEIGRSAEFGVEVDTPLLTRTSVFRGKVAVELLDGEGGLPPIPVDAGHAAVAERSSPARQAVVFVDDSPGDMMRFAHRFHLPTDREQHHETAWLKAIGTGPQRQLIAVGTGEDIEMPPRDDSPSFGDGSQTAESRLARGRHVHLPLDVRPARPGPGHRDDPVSVLGAEPDRRRPLERP